MYSKKDLALLREQKNNAIKMCEFQKAKMIDIQIKKITEEMDKSNTKSRVISNQMEYDKVKEAVRTEAAKKYSLAVEKIYEIKTTYQHRINTLIEKHSDELSALSEKLASDLELSSIRRVREQDLMVKEAQVKAKFGEFDEADALFQESNEMKETVLRTRQDEVMGLYDKMKDKEDRKYEEDLALNKEKQLQRISEVQLQYEKDVEKLKKQLYNMAIKYQIEQNLEEENGFFETLEMNSECVPMARSPTKKIAGGSVTGSPRTPPKTPPRSPSRLATVRSSPRTPRTPRTPSRTPKKPSVV